MTQPANVANRRYGLPAIFDNVRDGLVLVRFPSLEVMLFNRAASTLCRIPIDEAIGMPLDRLLPDPDLLLTAKKCSMAPMGAWPGHDQVVLQTRTSGRRGPAKDVEVHFCRVDELGTGNPLVLLVLRPSAVHDTLHAAHQETDRAERRVAKLEGDARDNALLFNQAAHEFKTPLTVLALQSEMLRAVLQEVAPSQERVLTLISANVHRLMLLSQDLADLAKADAGRLVVQATPVNLTRLLRDEIDNFHQLAAQSGLSIALLAPRKPISILGEPARLLQVVGNFLGNAIKFTPPGGRVTVELLTEDGDASVRIHDNGPGMDAEDQARLFRPFVRIDTPDAPRKPGTGLGLHLSKRIVEAHGGQVGCFSAGRGKGMTVWFNIPLAKQPDDWSHAAKAARQTASPPPTQGTARQPPPTQGTARKTPRRP
ncbi:MAG: hypothetical protein QOD77_234 [Thermoplasmata archaeon]|jgi:signal transduction histidine kinase|nr:hypothetical protein [Thermoplasmata archaeon]